MADGVVTIPFPGQPIACDPSSQNHGGSTSLSEFFAGPENRLVEPAVEGVLGRRPTPYNPLVLYGSSGTGKSHLARGLAAAWKSESPGSRIAYATCIDFARELADALETQAVEDFRCRYRDVDMAVFENVEELIGRKGAQEELIQTLDDLLGRELQVVATVRKAPAELTDLLPGLQSRLSAGLAVPLTAPGADARRVILQRWAKLREVELSEPVLRTLTEQLDGTVPELLGAMLQLEVPARLDGRTIDTKTVHQFLSERDSAERLPVGDIATTTARYFSLKLTDLRGSSRRRPVVLARDVAMFLTRLLTKESLQQIGRYFGGRDHTTVMHACRKTEERIKADPAIRQAVEHVRRRLQRC